MRWAIIKLTVVCLSLLDVAVVRAQTPDSPVDAPAWHDTTVAEAVPVEGNPTGIATGYQTGQSQPAQSQAAPPQTVESQPESVVSPAAEPQTNAAPPAEPPMAQWGDYSRPRPVPWIFPQRLYDLVGPPRGTIQPNFGQLYQGLIGDPNGLPAVDAGLTAGIDLARPDGIAPIGVTGANTVTTGRILLTARYLQGTFAQNYVGTDKVNPASILTHFPFAQRRLFQQNEDVTLQYGVTDDLNIMCRIPWQESSLDYVQTGGGSSNASFGNTGDVKVSMMYVLYREPGEQLHLNLGLSVPTGQLNPTNLQPSQTFPNFPYTIRNSSGTYDLMPGLTYRGQSDYLTWGTQATATIPTGLNHFGYELGNQVDLTTWLSARLTSRWATTARLDYQNWGNIRQADPRLNQSLSPTNVPGMQGGQRLNALMGINYFLPHRRVTGEVFSLEVGVPVYQSLDGPQLGLNWTLVAGWNLIY